MKKKSVKYSEIKDTFLVKYTIQNKSLKNNSRVLLFCDNRKIKSAIFIFTEQVHYINHLFCVIFYS